MSTEYEDKQNNTYTLKKLIYGMIFITLGIFAGYLSWQCNIYETTGNRIIYMVLSFFLSVPYLIYYFVIRILLNSPCNKILNSPFK